MARQGEGPGAGLHLRVSTRLLDRIDAVARDEGISRPEYVRTALAAALDRSEMRAAARARRTGHSGAALGG